MIQHATGSPITSSIAATSADSRMVSQNACQSMSVSFLLTVREMCVSTAHEIGCLS